MVRATFALLAALGASAAASSALAQAIMTPGGWEMRTTLTRELANKPVENMGSHTVKLCLTREFLAAEPYFQPNLSAASMQARQAQCTATEPERARQPDGESARWTMACTVADGSKLTARIANTASAERLQLKMVQDVERPGGGKGRVTMEGDARYVGACTDDMSRPVPPATDARR